MGLMQCHNTIELGSKENMDLKNEISMLRNELMKKYETDNQSASSISEKEREIYALKEEIAKLKSGIPVQNMTMTHDKPSVAKPGTSLEMLLNNSDSFATDYLYNLNMKPPTSNLPENYQFQAPLPNQYLNQQNMGLNSNPKQDMSNAMPTGSGYTGIESALPEAKKEPKTKGPRTMQGLPPNSQYKHQEWSPYDPNY